VNEPAANPFPVVGVGASAGGLEPLSQLLSGLSSQPGLAVVVIQHLDPHYESRLSSILQTHTTLRVVDAMHGQKVQLDQVYVIQPNTQVAIADGVLSVTAQPGKRQPHYPVDRRRQRGRSRMMRFFLESEGHVVATASDGPGALTAVAEFSARCGHPRHRDAGTEWVRCGRADSPRQASAVADAGRIVRPWARRGQRHATEAGFDVHFTNPVDIPTLNKLSASLAAKRSEQPGEPEG
jgi:CheY-like chemotaxis protein